MDIGAGRGTALTPAGTATIRYVAGTTVPSNWIPFLPVRLPWSNTEIRLQRARMPGAARARTDCLPGARTVLRQRGGGTPSRIDSAADVATREVDQWPDIPVARPLQVNPPGRSAYRA